MTVHPHYCAMTNRVLSTICIGAVAWSAALIPVIAAQPTPAPMASAAPAATATPDAAIMARAKEWLRRLQTGDIDRSQLDGAMNSALTADVVKQVSAKFGPLGDPQSFTYDGQQPVQGDMTAYVYRVTFKSATLNEVFVLHNDGKIAGIQLPPAQ